MNEQTNEWSSDRITLSPGNPISFGPSFLHYKIMVITPNSERRDWNENEGSLYRAPKDKSGCAEQEILEATQEGWEGVPRKWASWVGPQEPPLGSLLTWEAASLKPSKSALADNEKLGALVILLSPRSTYVFTRVLLGCKFHLDSIITKTFSLYEQRHRRSFKVI